jgi:hypothetical protein
VDSDADVFVELEMTRRPLHYANFKLIFLAVSANYLLAHGAQASNQIIDTHYEPAAAEPLRFGCVTDTVNWPVVSRL